MSIKLKGSSDGSVSFDAPADTSPSGSDITLTLPTSAGSANQFLKNSGTAGTLEYSSMVEDSSGRVGIGETSPGSYDSGARNLVVGSTGSTGILIKAGTSSYSNLYFGDGTGAASYRGTVAYNHSEDSLRFGTAGQERARFDSSGKFGIGENSPLGKLHVKTADSGATAVGASADEFVIEGSGHTGMTIISGTNQQCLINFADPDDANVGGITYSHSNNSLDFRTSDSTRMRILSHGSVRCGTSFSDSDYAENTTDYWHVFQHNTNNQAAFVIEHSGNSTPYGLIIDFSDAAPDDNTRYFMSCIDSSAIRLQIKSDGDIDNHDNSYSGFSDVKLKQDIVDAGSQWDDIKNLRVRKFRFKSDVAEHGDEAKTLIGVVAQETELVSPGLVKESPDLDKYNNDLGTTTKSVRYSVLYMKAVKALQEAQTRIETLETQNTAQQAQIDDLLARVTALEAA